MDRDIILDGDLQEPQELCLYAGSEKYQFRGHGSFDHHFKIFCLLVTLMCKCMYKDLPVMWFKVHVLVTFPKSLFPETLRRAQACAFQGASGM